MTDGTSYECQTSSFLAVAPQADRLGPTPSALDPPVLCRITPRVALTPYAFQFIKIIMLGKYRTNVGPCQTSFNLKRIIKGVPITTPIVLGALVYGT